MLVSSCTEIGADVVAGATVCAGVVNVSCDGLQLVKLRQPRNLLLKQPLRRLLPQLRLLHRPRRQLARRMVAE